MSGDFDGLAAPARRALANGGFTSLADLAKARRVEVARLHGMGPSALKILGQRMAQRNLNFAD